MAEYVTEALAGSLKGTLTCGSRCGYETVKEHTLEETIDMIDTINQTLTDTSSRPIPCIVREGTLVGRTETKKYREKVFTIDFAWSPRDQPMEKDEFYRTLLTYADILGTMMEQQRVYVEFDGKTEVLKKIE